MSSNLEIEFQQHGAGLVFSNANVTVFFGDRRSQVDQLQMDFPNLQFAIMQQVHSNVVIHSPQELSQEADAQVSRMKSLALCVRTADCIPLLVYDSEIQFCAAIHAGWRGVENAVICKTLRSLIHLGSSLKSAQVWMGPHIRAQSFEVSIDVGQKLNARFLSVKNFSSKQTSLLPHESKAKTYVDLSLIARAQLLSCGLADQQITELNIDTMTSTRHCSHRRDAAAAGRQLSFIALK